MTDAWLVVVGVGIGTIAIKAAGPVLLGGRALPMRIGSVVALLAPALLAALVVSASVALTLRAPILVVVLVAAVAAALARVWGIG